MEERLLRRREVEKMTGLSPNGRPYNSNITATWGTRTGMK